MPCELCGGVGFLRQDFPVGHPQFGRLIPCPGCVHVFQMTNLTEVEMGWTFDNIHKVNGIENLVDYLKVVIKRGWGFVFIHGNYGVGKTRVLKTLVATMASMGHEAYYIQLSDIVADLMKWDEKPPKYIEYKVLAIDEVDKLRSTEFALEQFTRLFDRRYVGAIRNKQVTLMASNSSPVSLPGYLQDRLRDGRVRVFTLNGKSIRPIMGDVDYG